MKKVLITGGNKGIGLEATKLFLDNGYFVTVVGRTASSLNLKSVELEKIDFDLSDTALLKDLVETVGDIDVLVNNAGVMLSIPFDEYPTEKREMIMNLNLYTPVKLIEYFSKGMIKNGGGRVVNVGSIAGQISHPDIWYGISKAGIMNGTKAYAKLLGGDGIVVNAVAPGPVDTDMMAVIAKDRVETLKNNTILKRVANPEDVAGAIYWLGTDSPEYINGVCINVNNGAYFT